MMSPMRILEFFRALRLKSDLQAGRETAVETLFHRYADGLFHYALAVAGDSDMAEDVVQQLFTDLVARPENLAKVYNLKSYLYQATRNRCLNAKKRSRREEPEELFESECPELGPAEKLSVQQALSSLSPEQREVVLLKLYHGLTFSEIGQSLEISPNTAASRYRYALQHLREELQPPSLALTGKDTR